MTSRSAKSPRSRPAVEKRLAEADPALGRVIAAVIALKFLARSFGNLVVNDQRLLSNTKPVCLLASKRHHKGGRTAHSKGRPRRPTYVGCSGPPALRPPGL